MILAGICDNSARLRDWLAELDNDIECERPHDDGAVWNCRELLRHPGRHQPRLPQECELEEIGSVKNSFVLITTLMLAASLGMAQAPAAPAAAPTAITTEDLKSVDTPKPEVRLKGDPDGALTGTVADIAVSDAKKGLTVARRPEPGRPEQDRHQLHLDAGRWLPGHVHASWICDRGNRSVPGQECEPHHDDELHGLRRRHAGLLADRFRDSNGRRGRRRQSGRGSPAQ